MTRTLTVIGVLIAIMAGVLIWGRMTEAHPPDKHSQPEEKEKATEETGAGLPSFQPPSVAGAPQGMPTGIQIVDTGVSVEIDQISLKLTSSGEVKASGNRRFRPEGESYPGLREFLEKCQDELSRGTRLVVILEAEDDAKGSLFVSVLNALADAGIENITLAGFTPDKGLENRGL